MFYESKIRVNGKKILKKSAAVSIICVPILTPDDPNINFKTF